MNKLISVALFLGLILGVVACKNNVENIVFSINEKQETGYKIDIAVDFGEIKDGRVKDKEFLILNQTEDILIVSQFRPSCGCTSIIVDATTVLPGNHLSGRVRYTPGRRKETKRYIERMTLTGNKITNVYFDVIVKVTPNVEYTPQIIAFQDGVNNPKKKVIDVRLNNFDKVKITKIESPTLYSISHNVDDYLNKVDQIIVYSENVDLDNDSYNVIKIFLDSGDVMEISIFNKEFKPFIVQPEPIQFYLMGQKKDLVQTVRVVPNQSTRDYGTISYSSPFDGITIEKQEFLNNYNADLIHVRLSPSIIRSSTQTVLIISSNDIEQKIPIFITDIN